MAVYQLTDNLIFPPAELAEEDGLLAIGGDLSPDRLLLAYSCGIFPWFSEGDPILWWSPSPRLVIFPGEFKSPRRLSRMLRHQEFAVTMDKAFREVIRACATVDRRHEKGTWITPDMIATYSILHDMGYAHSVECWQGDELAGGLYGISLGGTFFGESMFSRQPNSSKTALVHLAERLIAWDFDLIDCQMKTAHLMQFGAREIPGTEFRKLLAKSLGRPTRKGKWQLA
ncbi:MAG: leucyl/phenylalanyl-tRNA--protein transferase [Desulfobulbales bacterium]